MRKKVFRLVYALNYILQAALSMVIPAGLWILGGWYLRHCRQWGSWVMITAIILGVLTGMYSFFRYIVRTMNYVDPTAGKGDDHDGTPQ